MAAWSGGSWAASGRSFEGLVTSGAGYGSRLMAAPEVSRRLAVVVGFVAVPGTLNVRLPHALPAVLPNYVTPGELAMDPRALGVELECAGFRWAPAVVAGRCEGVVLRIDGPRYPAKGVELIGARNFRRALELRDGDILEFTVGGPEDARRISTVSDDEIVAHVDGRALRLGALTGGRVYEVSGLAVRTLSRPPGELLCRFATVNDLHFGELECGDLDGHRGSGDTLCVGPGEPPHPVMMNGAITTTTRIL